MLLDLEVQRVYAGLTAVCLGDRERFAPQAAASMRPGDEELVDERFASAVFKAEAQRHRDVSHYAFFLVSNPQAAERRVADEHQGRGARLGFDEAVAVLAVVAAHHADDRVDVVGARRAKARHAGCLRALRLGRSRARCRNQTSAASASAGI